MFGKFYADPLSSFCMKSLADRQSRVKHDLLGGGKIKGLSVRTGKCHGAGRSY